MVQLSQLNGIDNANDTDASSGAIQIAYLGPAASFSHQAALNIFSSSLPSPSNSVTSSPRTVPSLDLVPLPSFTAIFSAIQTQSHTYAVIPFENSTNGSVVQVLDLLAQCGLDESALYPDLEICAEHYLSIHHNLLVSRVTTQNPRGSNCPPTDQDDHSSLDKITSASYSKIKTIYTHPQVWGQCNNFLSARFTGIERIDVGSTSAAAQIAAKDLSGQSAAIASKLASQTHNLNCLAENIEDNPDANTTRFLVVRNQRAEPLPWSLTQNQQPQGRLSHINHKSLLTFTIPHSLPGSLADALAVFKQFNFNLTSIETRPSRQQNWHYVFLVECEENRQVETSEDMESSIASHETSSHRTAQSSKRDEIANLQEMLRVLKGQTESMRYLGSWIDMLQSNP